MPLRLSRDQVRRLDRSASEEYCIPGIVLMENAALAAADVASAMLSESGPTPGDVLILCGGGNNGGDGLAVARHLHNRGHRIQLALTIDPAKYHGDALTNYRITQAMHLPSVPADSPLPVAIAMSKAHLIIDAIFGTGLSAAPRPPFDQIADAVAKSGRPVLAIDIPSGLDCDTGKPLGPCIAAAQTITFVAEKKGFAVPEAQHYLGKVTVAGIGCPPELIQRIASQP
ncbi:MAG TPA: NAD(P)H-hydrate epimerase [Tepidisphaeraceae bacterium]|jgi:NAD(P)H-hydrate epimerase|nr:NAD(P)H-hydrate epimerase [Tepidisphaeraceae bacterium]